MHNNTHNTHNPHINTINTTQDVWADNSLPRLTKECRRCRHKEAVYFQSASFLTEDPMTLYFVCCNPNCGHQWVDESATKEK